MPTKNRRYFSTTIAYTNGNGASSTVHELIRTPGPARPGPPVNQRQRTAAPARDLLGHRMSAVARS
jgi:hypothetical protein